VYGRRWPFVIIVEESGATAAATGGEINEYIKAALRGSAMIYGVSCYSPAARAACLPD